MAPRANNESVLVQKGKNETIQNRETKDDAVSPRQTNSRYNLRSQSNKKSSTNYASIELNHHRNSTLLEEGEIRESIIGERNHQAARVHTRKLPAALKRIHENPLLGKGGLTTSRWTAEQYIGDLY